MSESQRFMENMQRFEQIFAWVRAKNIPLFVLYTCDRADLLPVPNQPKFKSEFVDRLKALKIPVIDLSGRQVAYNADRISLIALMPC